MRSMFATLPLDALTTAELEWRIAHLKESKVNIHNSLPPTATTTMLQVVEAQIVALNRTIERMQTELQNR